MSRTRNSDHQFDLDLGDDHANPGEPPSAPAMAAVLTEGERMENLLEQWQDAGWIRELDIAFARLIRELCREQGESPEPLLLLLAAMASHQVGRGHVCIDLVSLLDNAGQTLALPPEEAPRHGYPELLDTLPTPSDILSQVTLPDCIAAMGATSAVSDGSHTTPLVQVDTRLYLRRLWRYEQRIAEGIRSRLSPSPSLADATSPSATTLRQALDALFSPRDDVDYQKLACALAARNRFAIITGGPGTGKTTTVVNLLAALQATAGCDSSRGGRKFRIRLAAPTGKAAARLNESIGNAVNRLPLDQLPGNVDLADIPTRVTTLHRLLGSRPDSRKFRHHRDNPLLVDILVIDEASMVDVDLMASVFDALPDHAQLILLGDKDQLASVDAGAVLGELCQRASESHYRPATATWLEAVSGEQVPQTLVDEHGEPLDQAVAMLRKSYRFTEDSGIRQLAEAVNTNRLDQLTLKRCRDAAFDDVIWLNGSERSPDLEATLEGICRHAITGSPEAFRNRGVGRSTDHGELAPPVGYQHYLRLMNHHGLEADSPPEAWDDLARQVLEAFGDFQVLCALRKGPWGVEGLNDRIARRLLEARLIPRAEGWYAGRPILITGNDYNLGLMNGDIGITFSLPGHGNENGEPDTTLRVAFPSGDGTDGIRWISPSRLQQLETVYAMTVHKSQGSEFNHTCLVLPDRMSPVLTRELIYTGITRARNWFSLITGDPDVLTASSRLRIRRASGLAEALRSSVPVNES